jgi:hypothetical protein
VNKVNDTLNQHFDATAELTDAGRQIARIASAFYTTGNEGTAALLDELAQTVLDNSRKASDAFGAYINDRCNESERETKNLVGMVLGHILQTEPPK